MQVQAVPLAAQGTTTVPGDLTIKQQPHQVCPQTIFCLGKLTCLPMLTYNHPINVVEVNVKINGVRFMVNADIQKHELFGLKVATNCLSDHT